MLNAINLECRRGEQLLFSQLSFALDTGGLIRLRGANGSGKTSLLRMLCGLSRPEQGEILWDGKSIQGIQETYSKAIRYVAHLNALKDDLSPFENLFFSAKMNGSNSSEKSVAHALRRMGLENRMHLPVRVLSQGQRRRVALSPLVMGEFSPLWILDEPFNALDVEGVALLGEVLSEHIHRGGMAILTTHLDVQISARQIQHIELSAPHNG